MTYKSVFDVIEQRALKEGKPIDELLELSDRYYGVAQARYEASRDAVQKYMAEKLLWKHLGCKSIGIF
jgi:hypothetical protein